MRQTKTRQEVLSFLEKHREAYTAYEIASALSMNPVTTYRVLDFLKSQKKVHLVPSLGKWSLCAHAEHGHDDHQDHGFLICRKCDSVEEFTLPHECMHHENFQCEEHITEVFGLCKNCH